MAHNAKWAPKGGAAADPMLLLPGAETPSLSRPPPSPLPLPGGPNDFCAGTGVDFGESGLYNLRCGDASPATLRRALFGVDWKQRWALAREGYRNAQQIVRPRRSWATGHRPYYSVDHRSL
jgi:hypothetical protein